MIEPTGYTALDLIGFTDRGAYDPTANYVKNDIVTVGNTKWRCKVDDTTGVTPAENANWTIYLESATSLAGMDDTDITSPKEYDILMHNGTEWENSDVLKEQEVIPSSNLFSTVQGSGVISGITVVKNLDDTFSISAGTTSGSGFVLPTSDVANYVDISKRLLPNTTYKFLVGVANENMTLQVLCKVLPTDSFTTLVSTANVSEVEFTTPASFTYIYARVSIPISTSVPAMTLKPMITTDLNATVADYEPYWKALKDAMWSKEQQKRNGAYNLCPNDLISQFEAGITYQTLSDKTIQASGTASGSSSIWITKNIKLKKGTYKICGTPNGGHYNNGYALYVTIGNTAIATDTENTFGLSDIFTVTNEATLYNLGIVVRNGVTAPSAPFKPMITTDLNATYSDYEPYAKTNGELTNLPNNLGASVDLTGYTSENNMYEFPSDGYVRYAIRGNQSGTVTVYGNNGDSTGSAYLMFGTSSAINSTTTTVLRGSVYVRKGMKAFCTGTLGSADFIALK